MVSQPPTDTPFGLEPNIAAGLAYLFGIIGGVVMLAGGGTNKFVKWAAVQSITITLVFFVVSIALSVIGGLLHLWMITLPAGMLLNVLAIVVWLWTTITGFQGKEVDVPVIGNLTRNIFASQIA